MRAVVILILLLAGCAGKDSQTQRSPRNPSRLVLSIISGDGSIANVGSHIPLTVQLVDRSGILLQGAVVQFYGYAHGLGTTTTGTDGRASVTAIPITAGISWVKAYATTHYLVSNEVSFTVTGQ